MLMIRLRPVGKKGQRSYQLIINENAKDVFGDYLEKLIDDLMQGRTTPHNVTQEIAGRLASDLRQLESSGRAIKRPVS